MKVKEIKNSGLSVVKLGPRNRSLTRLFLCLYLSLNLVFPIGQVRAEEACRQCEQEPQPDLRLPDKFDLVFYQSVDPVLPGFLEKIKGFKSGPWGMFNKSFFDRTDKGSGKPFLVHHSSFELAVSAIENLVNQGDQSYEQISKIDEATGGVSVSGEFSGRLPSNSPEQVPRPDLDYRIKWVSIFGATYLFREVSVQEPVGQVAYLQLFGWVPETWGKPTWSKEKRCIEFVNAKIIEPTVNASLQTMVSVTHEGLKVVLPGYSGAAIVSEGKQIILGMFETAIGLATLGFMGKLNTMRKAVAWTVIGLSAGQLAAAIMYEPTVGQVAGAAIPAVLAIPYTLPVKWTRQIAAGGLIWYEMVFNSDKVDARILRRFKNLQELVRTSHVFTLSTQRQLLLEQAWFTICKENYKRELGFGASREEMVLAGLRIDGLMRTQRMFRQNGIEIPYNEALQNQFRFVAVWAALNKYFISANPKGIDMGHNVISDLILEFLPNSRYLSQKDLDDLLVYMIKDPVRFKNGMLSAQNWKGALDFSTTEEYRAFSQQEVVDVFYDAIKGMLMSTKVVDKPVYRLVGLKNNQIPNLNNVKHFAGPRATGPSPESVAEFAGQFGGQTDFAIMRISQPVLAVAGPGEGKIYDLGVGVHGMMVKNERVAYLGQLLQVSPPKCYVTQTIKNQQGMNVTIQIPVVDVILELK